MKTRIVPEGEDAVFHVVSRMAFQMLNLGDSEKRMFRDMLEKQAIFSGVEVLSYCLLDNHFHILIKIPHRPNVSDAMLLKRYSALYSDSESRYVMPPSEIAALLKAGGSPAKEMRTRLLARMGNVSIFMKELKQRFGIWYNRKHGNSGTLWAKRFDSVLVENAKKTLQIMAAYIDLNPVRLRLCKSPKDYAFCTLGEACKGNVVARRWLTAVSQSKQWGQALKHYEKTLSDHGDALRSGVISLKGMKSGVLGTSSFVQQWTHQRRAKSSTKRSLPSLILEGLLYAGGCALSAHSTFHSQAHRGMV